jgi:hypothetical protein
VTTGTVVIEESPAVSFSVATYAVNEKAEIVTITVTLDAPSAVTVTVDYFASDGTAIAGEDYVAISGTLVFTPGVTSQTFTVSIISDDVDEDNETVILILSNADNATIGGNNPTILTITEEVKVYLPLVLRRYP